MSKKQQHMQGQRGIPRLMSNFRLSLTFRIALHYCSQLLRTTLGTMLLISIVYAALQAPSIQDDILRLQRIQPDQGLTFTQEALQRSNAQAWLEEPPEDRDGHYLYAGLDVPFPGLKVVTAHPSGMALCIVYDLTDQARTLMGILFALLCADLFRMLYFIRKHRRLDKRVLAPIREITDMAATLSANSLSNRINVAGMKNELRDLATVINTMLDRIERSYNSQKQFVSDASHELRTPIAVIQGYVNMLQRWGKDDKTVLDESIHAIAQETQGMKELVESLLFLARHDKKTLMLEMSQFDVMDVVSELHREAAMVTPENSFILSPSENCIIEADRGMIKQVLRILCDNAVKYTPKGGVITLGAARRPGGCVLTVTDNGPGIPSEEIPKIFDRFYRSDTARKAESAGHGLGLSIARIIVVAHGGKLKVRSKVGAGSTFAIELPLRKLHTL